SSFILSETHQRPTKIRDTTGSQGSHHGRRPLAVGSLRNLRQPLLPRHFPRALWTHTASPPILLAFAKASPRPFLCSAADADVAVVLTHS
uniref:Uncharacterized protein n=5 Tax=Aegilops tauschii subsp. strangulata TaxID=200361 RepID=A0A453C4D6_AEGTS